MNIVRAIFLTLLSLHFSSELLHATAKKNLTSLESKKVVPENQIKGKALEESKKDGCWWDNRGGDC